MFVFENVAGITSARGGRVFLELLESLNEVGYTAVAQLKNAKDFGVLQNRKRMIIIGWKEGTDYFYPIFRKKRNTNKVWDLLDDLGSVSPGKQNNHYRLTYEKCSDYLKRNRIRKKRDVVTDHIARAHNERDLQIYRLAIEEYISSGKSIRYDQLPEHLKTHRNQSSFIDRFKVVEGDNDSCHTVLAHLAKDGHYFIHPDLNQCRSITVREAARLQSFPDDYYFEGSRGEKYKQIGNAVPPIMALGIAT